MTPPNLVMAELVPLSIAAERGVIGKKSLSS